jgi:LEA14-like dessication related protein
VKKAVWMALLLLVASCAGCGWFVKDPVVTVQDLRFVSLDGNGAVMDLYLSVKNPNSFDIRLLGYSYDLKVLMLPLAQGGAREELKFLQRSETDLRIPIKVSYNDLMEILKRRPDPERIPYGIAAGLDVETPMGTQTVTVNRTGTYAIPAQYRPGNFLKRLGDFMKGAGS